MTSEPTPVKTRKPLLITAVAVVVVAALAWLCWPASDSGPVSAQAVAGPYSVRLSAENPKQGTNSLGIEVTDAAGKPAALDVVTVEPVMPQMGHALAPITAGADGPGHYRAAETTLPMSGQWEITVTLRGPAGTDQAVFPLLVKN
jgi:nitrogen fixation protein FixH